MFNNQPVCLAPRKGDAHGLELGRVDGKVRSSLSFHCEPGRSVPRLEEEASIWDQRWREHMQAGNGSPLHISATHRSGRTFLSAEDVKEEGMSPTSLPV